MTVAKASSSPARSSTINAGVRKREVFGWAMYDFANSGFTTVVITAVFSAYFVGAVAQGAAWGALAWTTTLGVSYALVMLSMPALGAWADLHGAKKRLLGWVTLLCLVSTAALAWVQPGDLVLACILVVVANTAFSWGESVSYAFLPELAKPEAMGKVSGWGWGLGYAGGMLTLGICLVWVMSAQARGETAADFVPITMVITAVMYGAASLFTFALLKERTLPTKSTDDVASAVMAVPERTLQGFQASMRRLHETWQASARYRDFSLLLGSAVFYQGGVAVAITLAAIYAQQVIGFQPQEIMVLVFVINAAAMIGALVFGHLQDKMGHRLTLSLTLVGWTITCILAGLATTKLAFWYAAALAGVCMGSSQSCGRAMAGLLAPSKQLAEFYGLWSFATRLAAIAGPLMYGLITWGTGGDQRTAIFSTALLFVVGLGFLIPLDMARGQRAAQDD